MLLNALLIILRETLEAGVLVSVLLTLVTPLSVPSLRWVLGGLLLGLFGAAVYAAHLNTISQWFDYVGQEVVNASLQYSIYFLLLLICMAIGPRAPWQKLSLIALVAMTLALALVREGAEILLYFSGYWQQPDVLPRVLTSGFMGLMIGASVGVLIYYGVRSLPERWQWLVQLALLVLIAAGMVAQATQLLQQADWLPSSAPVWDTSGLLSEQSLLGELLYATLGYEASPTIYEAAFYGLSIILVPFVYGASVYWVCRSRARPSQDSALANGFDSK